MCLGIGDTEQQRTHLTSLNDLPAKLFGLGLIPAAIQRHGYVEQTFCET